MGAVVGLQDKVRALHEKIEKLMDSNKFESNKIGCVHVECFYTDGPLPVATLIVLDGSLNRVMVLLLKDDGCNTKIGSERLVEKYRMKFNIVKREVVIQQSKSGTYEDSSQLVVNGTLKIVDHLYLSNWVVSNSRQNLLLKMPWHVYLNPKIDYDNQIVKVGDVSLNCKQMANRMRCLSSEQT